MEYNADTIYVVGDAQASQNNPIKQQYNVFFIGLVVDTTNGKIVDAGCSATIPLTSAFVRSIFIGQSIYAVDAIEASVRSRYFGSSQRSLIVAYKDALKKYKLAIETREKLSI
ncbi:DUF3870 domain-containing protein [Brevibacillus fulvus]|uniref:DUF3870 domain-containing protein n=1 Tax=Brevibacillus fulvus TaxID=1125967 RepID=A0A938XZG5_9BACL|nr:hypothetical protein [Brevibacillus fulvus]